MDVGHTEQINVKKEIPKIKVVPLLAVLLSGAFVAILNETILNVALNAIMSEFNVAYSTVQWLVTGYMLIIGTLIPISAYFMQRFTTRQLFITAMSLFTLGTLVAGISPIFSVLLIGRLIQAIATAIMIPLLTNVILSVIPIERRGAAMGMVGLVIMFAPAIGPTVSGLIVENLSWRLLFYFVIPISIFSLLFGIKILKNVTEVSRPKLDVLSFILSTLGFGGIVYGFSAAWKGDASFADPVVFSCLIVGFVSLALFSLETTDVRKTDARYTRIQVPYVFSWFTSHYACHDDDVCHDACITDVYARSSSIYCDCHWFGYATWRINKRSHVSNYGTAF
ncbi:MFS transporter [Alkalicoccobacillus plakortidis]|uniref:MFS transporter n=1 Tax=Alkalicoccobacillus plakortidis TaxID=444060 RepID=UPI00358DBFE9